EAASLPRRTLDVVELPLCERLRRLRPSPEGGLSRALLQIPSGQPDQPGPRLAEAAGAVEGFEMRFEIDVEPVCAAYRSRFRRPHHQLRRDTAAAMARHDAGVEDEGVAAAVPGDVDEADEAIAVIGAEMGEAA